jgi:hypothetical protein
MRTRSVHTFGLERAVMVITIDSAGGVRRVARLTPGRILTDPGAVWTAELPADHPPPMPGWRLRVAPILAACPES